jgi:nucleoside 2-deoxyribosyltransferase
VSSKKHIYLAARWSRKKELAAYATRLEDLGYVITSRWLYRSDTPIDDFTSEAAAEIAAADVEDILRADWLVFFADTPRTATRGGRMFELGLAWPFKRTVCIGKPENVFMALPSIEKFDTFQDFDRHLSTKRRQPLKKTA